MKTVGLILLVASVASLVVGLPWLGVSLAWGATNCFTADENEEYELVARN